MLVDDAVIAAKLREWADAYDKRGDERPFTFDKHRATGLRKGAEAIEAGRHLER